MFESLVLREENRSDQKKHIDVYGKTVRGIIYTAISKPFQFGGVWVGTQPMLTAVWGIAGRGTSYNVDNLYIYMYIYIYTYIYIYI